MRGLYGVIELLSQMWVWLGVAMPMGKVCGGRVLGHKRGKFLFACVQRCIMVPCTRWFMLQLAFCACVGGGASC